MEIILIFIFIVIGIAIVGASLLMSRFFRSTVNRQMPGIRNTGVVTDLEHDAKSKVWFDGGDGFGGGGGGDG